MKNVDPSRRPFPIHGYLGLVLVAVFWYLNWGLDGLRTHWGFFPLWLGYCLVVDAVCVLRSGSSLLTRNPIAYAALFAISAPCWWLFELINERTQYWVYSAREQFSDLEYFAFATLSFSTVVPAVFGTSSAIATLKWSPRLRQWSKISSSRATKWLFFGAGWLMLFVVLMYPNYGAPFLWISLFFILDPINMMIGQPSIIQDAMNGNWRKLVTLWVGVLICGFFWELWNLYSSPKWFYEIPGVDYWYVFEMPLPGYLGYLPFALELYAMYFFILAALGLRKWNDYLRL